MTEAPKRMFLVDGSAVFYRAYFAFIRNPLINSKGENTSATFGFVNSLLKILRDEEPDYFAVVFDTKHPTFRHKRYPEYKSTRAKMPEDLVDQLPRIRQAVDAMAVPSFELEGYEADDIVGTIARRAERRGIDVWCVTGDKDYFQLVTDHVKVYTPRKASEQPDKLGREGVKDKFGVYPELVIDKLALMGDSSDNVPGIPGIGAKTADKLLEQFGTLDGVLENWGDIKAKGVRTKVSENIEMARLSRELVTIDVDVPIDIDIEELKRREPDNERLRELFLEMEFTNLLKLVSPEGGEVADGVTGDAGAQTKSFYHTVTTIAELKKLIDAFVKVKEVAVDTETTSINALEANLVGVSLADRAGTAYYIPLAHSGEGEVNLPVEPALKELKRLLENKKVQKIGQNIKYDLEVFHRYDIDIVPVSFDTMLASYVLNPSERRHSLDMLALKHFNYQMQPISDLIGSGKGQKTFDIVPVSKATFYAAEDADYTYRLRGVLAPMVHERELENLLYNIEIPLIYVLAAMEEAGIRVDDKYLAKLSARLEKSLDGIQKKIYEIAGTHFNINSTQQLSHILFDKLGLPTKGKTAKKTGYSTDVRVLEELADMHPFPQQILDFRQLTKLKSTYVDAIPRLISPETGRVHTSFNQFVAATGRLSSTDPNLQNIPVRTPEGREIRKAFVPRDHNHVLLAADYSQVELRVLAHYSKDKGLIKAFKNGEDIHRRTAAEVYGVELDGVTSEMRRAAKTANFAVIYGVTAFGLAQQTELNLEESKTFIDTYFERYPGIRKYMDDTIEFARQNGYVTTLFNRRRYLPEINEKNRNVRQFAERTAINTPIQGTAADIIKRAMLKIHDRMKGMRSRMVLQVHDELVFDVHKDELDEVRELVVRGMEKAAVLNVPLVADVGVGDNWLEAK
ncbi:MAG: DNA polymerase I [candidate division Zixibacteria bacterium]|nr:DNA polymerase I [candidate division Zixibacteria bacterium]